MQPARGVARRARKRGGTSRGTNGSGDEARPPLSTPRKARNAHTDTRGGRGASRVQRGANRRAPTSNIKGGSVKSTSTSSQRPSPTFVTKSASNLSYSERFQQLREQRELERAEAIKNGFLADPDKPRSLADAITPVGVCPDMCAEFERVERIVQKDIWGPETDPTQASLVPSQRQPDEARMVKKFRRAAAGIDEQLPSDLRPPYVLEKTIDYLFNDVVGQADSLASVHHFVWDRTRAIRNDFSIQQVTKPADVRIAMDCYERIARFHILSLHQLALPDKPYDKYDAQQEREQLDKTLLSLMQYYDDSRGRIQSPNEAEFRAYCILFQIQDPKPDLEDRVQSWPKAIVKNPRVERALRLYAAAGSTLDKQGPLKPETYHLVAQGNWKRFWALIESEEVSYLMACVAEIYFGLVRRNALHSLWQGFRQGGTAKNEDWTLSELIEVFGFHDEDEVREFCTSFQFKILEKEDGTAYLDLTSVSPRDGFPVPPSSSIAQTRSHLVEQKRCNRTLPAVINGLTYHAAEKAGALEEPALMEDVNMEEDEALFVRDESDVEEQIDAPKGIPASESIQSKPLESHPSSEARNFLPQGPQPEASRFAPMPGQTKSFGLSTESQGQSVPTSTIPNPFNSFSQQPEKSKMENNLSNPFKFPSQPLGQSAPKPSGQTSSSGAPPASSQSESTTTHSRPFASNPFTDASDTTQFAKSNPFASPQQRLPSGTPQPTLTNHNPFSQPAAANLLSSSVQTNPFSLFQPTADVKMTSSAQHTETSPPATKAKPFEPIGPFAGFSETKPSQPDPFQQTLRSQLSAPASSKESVLPPSNKEQAHPSAAEPTSIAGPSTQKRSTPVANEGEKKEQVLDKIAQLIVTENRGYLEQFVEFTVGPLISIARAQAEQERANRAADDFRESSLSRRYGIKWRNICWKRRLSRVGKERRQRFKDAQARVIRSRESSVDADYDALRQSWNGSNQRLNSKPLSNGRKYDDSTPNRSQHTIDGAIDTTTGQYSHRRAKSSVEISASSPDRSSSLSTSRPTQHQRHSILRKSPLSNEYNPYAPYSSPPKRIDTTKSTYFKLKALGIDPNTGVNVLSRSNGTDHSRKRSRQSDIDVDMDDDSSIMAPPPRKRSHTASSSTSPQLVGASMAAARQSEDGLVSSPQPSNSSALTAEDEELFAGLRSMRSAMNESIAFFRTEIAREEHRQSQSPQRSRESSVAMSGISGRSLQRDAPPAYRSRPSKFLPREMYADVLMAKRAATELEDGEVTQGVQFKQEDDERHEQSWSGKGGTSVEDAIEL